MSIVPAGRASAQGAAPESPQESGEDVPDAVGARQARHGLAQEDEGVGRQQRRVVVERTARVLRLVADVAGHEQLAVLALALWLCDAAALPRFACFLAFRLWTFLMRALTGSPSSAGAFMSAAAMLASTICLGARGEGSGFAVYTFIISI